jgi:hypothetical protein
MKNRRFFGLVFAPENQMGKGVELETYDLAGCTPESIEHAARAGKPIPGFNSGLYDGVRLGGFPPGIKLYVARSVRDSLDFEVVANPLGWMIVSNRLGSALNEAAANDVELLPVQIRGMNEEILRSDFCVINVLHLIDALSEKKSLRAPEKMGSIYPVLKLAVIATRVPATVHVFRLIGWPYRLIIDDVAKRSLTKLPHDGLVFNPIEQE